MLKETMQGAQARYDLWKAWQLTRRYGVEAVGQSLIKDNDGVQIVQY